jgi:hypothetical protein
MKINFSRCEIKFCIYAVSEEGSEGPVQLALTD